MSGTYLPLILSVTPLCTVQDPLHSGNRSNFRQSIVNTTHEHTCSCCLYSLHRTYFIDGHLASSSKFHPTLMQQSSFGKSENSDHRGNAHIRLQMWIRSFRTPYIFGTRDSKDQTTSRWDRITHLTNFQFKMGCCREQSSFSVQY